MAQISTILGGRVGQSRWQVFPGESSFPPRLGSRKLPGVSRGQESQSVWLSQLSPVPCRCLARVLGPARRCVPSTGLQHRKVWPGPCRQREASGRGCSPRRGQALEDTRAEVCTQRTVRLRGPVLSLPGGADRAKRHLLLRPEPSWPGGAPRGGVWQESQPFPPLWARIYPARPGSRSRRLPSFLAVTAGPPGLPGASPALGPVPQHQHGPVTLGGPGHC